MTEVFTPWNQNFGDIFATIQLLSRRAIFTKQQVHLSRWQNGTDLKEMMEDIQKLLVTPPSPIHLVAISDEPGNTTISGYDVWACEYFPTFVRWCNACAHPYYTYQFDGLSSPELKNPPPEDVEKITTFLSIPGVKLGLPMQADASAKALAGCMFFVGVDSGMAHLAHSVNCPIFLLQYQLPVVTCHRGKPYILCEGADDFIVKVKRYRDMLFTVGHPDGWRSDLAR